MMLISARTGLPFPSNALFTCHLNSISTIIMSIAHGIRTLGVLGAGQMGTGIALVAAIRAKVPVYLHDRSPEQIIKGLGLIDKLLAKDVAKGRLTNEQAKEARERVKVVEREQGIQGLRDVDMVVEVRMPFRSLFIATKWNAKGCIRKPIAQTNNI